MLFTYLFGGAISGGDRHGYLQFLLPGMLAQSLAMGGIALGQNLNADIEKWVFDRFRSLPVSRAAPLVGAVLADIVRYLTVCRVMLGFGTLMGFRISTDRSPRSPPSGVAQRLAAVLAVTYAIFNEGYAATGCDHWTRPELCSDAVRLRRSPLVTPVPGAWPTRTGGASRPGTSF